LIGRHCNTRFAVGRAIRGAIGPDPIGILLERVYPDSINKLLLSRRNSGERDPRALRYFAFQLISLRCCTWDTWNLCPWELDLEGIQRLCR